MTREQLQRITTKLDYDRTIELFEKYDLVDSTCIAMFLAQCAHESNEFKAVEENLNYSVNGLLKVFPRYFGDGKRDPKIYARVPEKIANYVYSNRMGNGDEKSGDGWKYRGRGYIQVTGKDNYTNLNNFLNMQERDLLNYLATPTGALESALWYWSKNNLSDLCNPNNIAESCRQITKKINGGYNGLEDRTNKTIKYLEILNS